MVCIYKFIDEGTLQSVLFLLKPHQIMIIIITIMPINYNY